MNYGTSRREAEVMEKVKNKELVVFNPKDVRRLLDTSMENVHRILRSMKKKGLVISPERNKYILKETWESEDLYSLTSHLFTPSYIALWSALHFHGMTDQVPQTVFLLTTGRKDDMVIQGQEVRFVKIKKNDYFGYESNGKTVVSDTEKTVLDCLKFPQYAGGIGHILQAIPEDIDKEKIVEYVGLMNSSTIASRIGYLLEKKGMEVEELKEMVTTYAKLDPKGERENLNKRWKLYINTEIEC